MRRLFTVTGLLLTWGCFVLGYGLPTLAQAQKPKTEGATTAAASSPQAVRGGILKAIRCTFPKILGYQPEQSPTDTIFALPYGERLADWDEKGNLIPVLAESWEATRRTRPSPTTCEKA